jgi:hypothetical protein
MFVDRQFVTAISEALTQLEQNRCSNFRKIV